MLWSKLLCDDRLAADKHPEPLKWRDYPIDEFEKDYKKIISSSAFRRLQDKTQVFPLDKIDFVRTRLTHSIEVSTIAKQLGVMVHQGICRFKSKTNYSLNTVTPQSICNILMCAGLLHDLGNPPFGHFGEVVIGDWFKNNIYNENFKYKGKKVSEILSEQMIEDLKNFEGNAQALRILSKCCKVETNNDLNLTAAVINTLIKYPTSSLCCDKENEDIKKHKNGYFFAEEVLLNEIANKTETIIDDTIVRHPLTFILESADDIAYVTADLEDAFKKGLFTIEELIKFYDSEIEILEKRYKKKASTQASELIQILRNAVEADERTSETDLSAFNEWVKEARGWLMYVAAYRFTNSYDEIMSGTFKCDLFFQTNHELSVLALKNAMVKFAFHSSSILKLELSAQTIITFLMDKFIPGVLYFGEKDKTFRQSKADTKYTDLISENYKNDYISCKTEDSAYNLYLRFLLITDYISGMTDSFAKNLYQELNGVI